MGHVEPNTAGYSRRIPVSEPDRAARIELGDDGGYRIVVPAGATVDRARDDAGSPVADGGAEPRWRSRPRRGDGQHE